MAPCKLLISSSLFTAVTQDSRYLLLIIMTSYFTISLSHSSLILVNIPMRVIVHFLYSFSLFLLVASRCGTARPRVSVVWVCCCHANDKDDTTPFNWWCIDQCSLSCRIIPARPVSSLGVGVQHLEPLRTDGFSQQTQCHIDCHIKPLRHFTWKNLIRFI